MSIPLADRTFSTVELTRKVKKLTPGVKQPERSLPRNWIDTPLNFAAFTRPILAARVGGLALAAQPRGAAKTSASKARTFHGVCRKTCCGRTREVRRTG